MNWLEAENHVVMQELGAPIEQDTKPSIGVAVFVVGVDEADPQRQPWIWTITENHTKDATDKKSGQLSSPAETGKVGESSQETTLAAIAEFTDSDADLARLRVLEYKPKSIDVNGNPADVVIIHYDGPLSDPHNPMDPNETAPNGWMKPEELRRMNGELRSATHSTLAVVSDEDLRNLLDSRSSLPHDTIRDHVGPDFSLRAFIAARNGKDDILLS